MILSQLIPSHCQTKGLIVKVQNWGGSEAAQQGDGWKKWGLGLSQIPHSPFLKSWIRHCGERERERRQLSWTPNHWKSKDCVDRNSTTHKYNSYLYYEGGAHINPMGENNEKVVQDKKPRKGTTGAREQVVYRYKNIEIEISFTFELYSMG